MNADSLPIKIQRHPAVASDLKRLRRFRTIDQSLGYFGNLLARQHPKYARSSRSCQGQIRSDETTAGGATRH